MGQTELGLSFHSQASQCRAGNHGRVEAAKGLTDKCNILGKAESLENSKAKNM